MKRTKSGLNLGRRTCEVHGASKDYFCMSRDCMTDLCKDCFNFHDEIHHEHGTEMHIEKLDDIFKISIEKLERMIWGYQKEIKKLERGKGQRDQDWVNMIDEVRENMIKSKKVVINAIDMYFNEIEEQLMAQYIFPAKKVALGAFDDFADKLKFKMRKLEIVRDNIQKGDFENEMIKYVISKNENYLLESLEQNVSEMILMESEKVPDSNNVEVTFDQEKLQDVYSALQNFVILDINFKELVQDSGYKTYKKQDFPTPLDNNNSTKGIYEDKVQTTKNEIVKRNSAKRSSLKQHKINDANAFYIDRQDFFESSCKYKLMHFFEPKTKNFYFIDLEEKIKTVKKNVENSRQNIFQQITAPFHFETIELDIDFVIPRHHQSLITPDGFIILIGGFNQLNNNKVNIKNDCYLLNIEDFSLEELSPMNYPRAAHAVVYTSSGILVVGGITDDCHTTTSCEIYNIESNEWLEIAPLNKPSINCSLCNIDDLYVVKLGGKVDEKTLSNVVEVLSLKDNEWWILEQKTPIQELPTFSSSVQINDNQILLFGGSYAAYDNKTDHVFVITFDEDKQHYQVTRAGLNLTNKEGFSNQQAIIYNRYIFALQNFPNPNDGKIFVNIKKLLCINEMNCLSLN